MDESHFRELITAQQESLAELDSILNAKETHVAVLPDSPRDVRPRVHRDLLEQDRQFRTRFDDVCRLLAEAYLLCDDRQRAVLRDLVQSFRGVTACMWIGSDEIRTKIDGARFRFALVYESIKDYHPDADDTLDQVENICRSAKRAGFDPNPYLLEIADLSNTVGHSGKGSMKELLLSKIVTTDKARCERCDRLYSIELPECPFCGAFNPWPQGKTPTPEPSEGEPGPDELATGYWIEVKLPTIKLIGYVLLLIAPAVLLALVAGQILRTFQADDYHLTRGAWSFKVIIVLLAAIIIAFRSAYAHMWSRYRRGYGLWIGCGQMLAIFVALIGMAALVITFVVNYGALLGW